MKRLYATGNCIFCIHIYLLPVRLLSCKQVILVSLLNIQFISYSSPLSVPIFQVGNLILQLLLTLL